MACDHEFLRQRNGGICPACVPGISQHREDLEIYYRAATNERKRRIGEACRRSFARYFRESWAQLEPATPLADSWHIDVICNHLQAQFVGWLKRKRGDANADPEFQNTLINVPPGTAKSRIVSVAWPTWCWLHAPYFKWAAVSGNPNVAIRDADLSLQLVEGEWYRDVFAVKWAIRPDAKARNWYKLHQNGKDLGDRRSFGIKSEYIGERADGLVVDDPHDPRTVFSKTVRDDVLYRYDRTFSNRLNNLGQSIRTIVAQRTHVEDLSGHVLSTKGQKWCHVKIPLEYSPDRFVPSPLRWIDPREKGEILQPDRFPTSFIESEKARLLSLFECLYNQDPVVANGGLFERDWFRFFRLPDDPAGTKRPFGVTEDEAVILQPLPNGRFFDRVSLEVDATFKKTTTGSEVGLIVLGQRGGNYYLLDDLTRPGGFRETCDIIPEIVRRWPEIDTLHIEDKANGPAIIDVLRGTLPGVAVVAVSVDASKIARAASVAPLVQARQLYLREGLPSLAEFVDQLVTFPNSKRNDRVDALAQGLREFRKNNYTERFAMMSQM